MTRASSSLFLAKDLQIRITAVEPMWSPYTCTERVAALLQNYLEGRRTETKNYLPEAYSLLSEAEVVREGCLVMLVIGEQADEEIRLLTAEE